jgi:hypothetical protein
MKEKSGVDIPTTLPRAPQPFVPPLFHWITIKRLIRMEESSSFSPFFLAECDYWTH